jgi:hypothetical protein
LKGSILSILSNSVLVSIDDNLYFSAADATYGAKYGKPGWFASATDMSLASNDLELWRTFNMIRGFSGLFNWFCCSLCLDKTRYWSIVDTKLDLKNFENEQQQVAVV